MAKLKSELSTASNIKNRAVRKAVKSALRSGIRTLKKYKKSMPENGIVLCAGDIVCNDHYI